MKRRVGTLIGSLVALGATVFAAQSVAASITSWAPAGSPVMASANLKDVAANSSVVVAVGEESGEAAVYHRAGNTWVKDQIEAHNPTVPSHLTAVAIGGSSAWLVGLGDGTDLDDLADDPLIRRIPLADLGAPTPVIWRSPTILPSDGSSTAGQLTMGAPTGLALRGAFGVIVDNFGQAFPISEANGGTVGAPAPPLGEKLNDVSLYRDANGVIDGFAVGNAVDGDDPTQAATHRLFQVKITITPLAVALSPVPLSNAGAEGAWNLAAVGVVQNGSTTNGIAIEADGGGTPAYWESTSQADGRWERKPDRKLQDDDKDPANDQPAFADSLLSDVAAGIQGTVRRYLVAGAHDGEGAVWRFDGGWKRELLGTAADPAATLRAIAFVSDTNIWAVGDSGAVYQYARREGPTPPPFVAPDTRILSPGSNATVSTTTPSFRFEAVQPPGTDIGRPEDITFECSYDGQFEPFNWDDCASSAADPYQFPEPFAEGRHVFRVRAINATGFDRTPAVRTFTVQLPRRNPACTTPQSKRVRKNSVSFVKKRRKLVVRFALRVRSRVRLFAVAGSRTVGKTSWHTLNRGRRQLVVRFRRTPTTLRLIARPVSNCDT